MHPGRCTSSDGGDSDKPLSPRVSNSWPAVMPPEFLTGAANGVFQQNRPRAAIRVRCASFPKAVTSLLAGTFDASKRFTLGCRNQLSECRHGRDAQDSRKEALRGHKQVHQAARPGEAGIEHYC